MSATLKNNQDDKAAAERLRREADALEFSATWLKTRKLYGLARLLWFEAQKRRADAIKSEERSTLAKIERSTRSNE